MVLHVSTCIYFFFNMIENCKRKAKGISIIIIRNVSAYQNGKTSKFFSSTVLDRLSTRWGHLTSLIESGSYEEENTDTQEMLEDLLIRMLTREYVDVSAYGKTKYFICGEILCGYDF